MNAEDIELQTNTNSQNVYEELDSRHSVTYTEIRQQPQTNYICNNCTGLRWFILFLAIFITFGFVVVLHFVSPVLSDEAKDDSEKNLTRVANEPYQNELHRIKGDITKLQVQVNEFSKKIEAKNDITQLQVQVNQLSKKIEAKSDISLLQAQVNELSKKIEAKIGCYDGWKRHEIKCYFFSTFKADWYQARKNCMEKNGILAEPKTRAEIEFLRTTISLMETRNLPQNDYWIGGTDRAREGRWVWESDQQAIILFDWITNEPNNDKGDEDCAEVRGNENTFSRMWNQRWNDISCTGDSNRFVCQKSI